MSQAKINIEHKILSVYIKDDVVEPVKEIPVVQPIGMNEKVTRDYKLFGATYKVKPPNSAAMYITINDVILDGKRHPYEIFIVSKDMDNFQWIVALTRVISAVFRKGGDIEFMVEELKSVFDPKGGYFKKGGLFMPSLVAEIGNVIEEHLISLGHIKSEELSDIAKETITKKKEELGMSSDSTSFPDSAQVCKKCSTKAVVILDGCQTCLNCGESKCS